MLFGNIQITIFQMPLAKVKTRDRPAAIARILPRTQSSSSSRALRLDYHIKSAYLSLSRARMFTSTESHLLSLYSPALFIHSYLLLIISSISLIRIFYANSLIFCLSTVSKDGQRWLSVLPSSGGIPACWWCVCT